MRLWFGAPAPLDLNRNVTRASDHLEKILETIGIQGGLAEDEIKAAWSKLAGEMIARQTEPVSLRRGCLTLKVTQPAMRFHLEQLKPSLLKKLQTELGADQISSLRLTLG